MKGERLGGEVKLARGGEKKTDWTAQKPIVSFS
jgi:hypothetical protein